MAEFRRTVKPSSRRSVATERTLDRARELRRAMSPPERKLWVRIRGRQLGGLRFRRQHPIGPYAADFYCEEARLVVELDGGYHADRREQDAARDEYMRSRGVEVLRISVSEFERDIPGALELIRRTAGARIEEAMKNG